MRDAKTGEIIWKLPSVHADEEGGDKGEGPGRGMADNIDPRYPGSECWAFGAGMSGLYNSTGKKISDKTPRSCNFEIWWDGDLLREILDRNYIAKWNWEKEELVTIFTATGCTSNNWTKSNPVLSADLFGDWREEVIFRTIDNKSLRVYTTTIPTKHRMYTLMHDPIYRLGIAWQNVAYNQPPHTGFYIGDDMQKPPKPNIFIIQNIK
jgi:rhamnogalacturonan endolyase